MADLGESDPPDQRDASGAFRVECNPGAQFDCLREHIQVAWG